jgi:tetratricopeptide (TPR) repeat protein
MIALLLAAQVTRQINRAMHSGDPDKFKQQLDAAGIAWKQGNKEESLKAVEAAAKVAPDDSKTHQMLAVMFKRFGRTRQSLEHTEKATRLQREPTLKDLAMLANGYLDENDIKNANRILEECILPRWPESADAELLRGLIALEDEEVVDREQTAIRCFRKALEKQPENQFVRFKLAQCFSQTGELEAAEAELRTILKQNANHWGAIHHLGDVLRLQGRMDEATVFLNQHEEIDAKLQRLRFLRTQRSLKQHTPENLLEMGTLYADRSDYRKARDAFLEYTRLRPKDPNGHRQLAKVHQTLGNETEANFGLTIAESLEQLSN